MRNSLSSWLMVLLLLVIGCRPTQVVSDTSTEVMDSTFVGEVPRYVEVIVPGDTVKLTEYIECDSVTNKPKPVKTKVASGRATQQLSVDSDGKLEASCECDSLKQVVEVMDKEIFRLKRFSKVTVKQIPKIIYKTRWYDKAARWIASIVILIVGGYALYKFKKP